MFNVSKQVTCTLHALARESVYCASTVTHQQLIKHRCIEQVHLLTNIVIAPKWYAFYKRWDNVSVQTTRSLKHRGLLSKHSCRGSSTNMSQQRALLKHWGRAHIVVLHCEEITYDRVVCYSSPPPPFPTTFLWLTQSVTISFWNCSCHPSVRVTRVIVVAQYWEARTTVSLKMHSCVSM